MGGDRTRDPQRDKELSLSHDCRNSYGKSRHAARKAIPRRRQLAHKATRAAVKRDLSTYERLDAEGQDVIESSARNDTHSMGSCRKEPDAPLRAVIERQARVRARDDGRLTQEEYLDLPFVINDDVREARTKLR